MKFLHFLLTLLLLICINLQMTAQKYTLSGYITDKSSGEALIGATIVDVNEPSKGTATNVYGFYSLTLPEGTYNFRISYVGYAEQRKTITLSESTTLSIELEQEQTSLQEVVVSAERADKNVTSVEMSRENLKIERIKKIPALLGEVDVIKSIQLLPGVTNAGEGTSGLFVRGGSSDQNLILLDEATVYNASHLLGFFSVFNPDAVKNVELYKGGIPARFGGRVSSILDIQMRDGNNKKFNASGGIGSISSRLTLETPIVKDKSSLLISGRRTYADLFLAFAQDENIRNNTLYFYDLNLKANYTINEKNKVFLSGYFGRDNLGFQDQFGFDWGNGTFTARWNHLFSDKLFLNTTLLYSNFDYGFDINSAGLSFNWQSGLQAYNAKLDFDYFPNSKNTIQFGVNSIYHVFSPATITSTEGSLRSIGLPNDFAIENAVYIGNQHEISKKLSMEYGLRYSAFAKIGADSVAIYEPELRRQEENRIGTDVYGSGELVKFYDGLEPRFGLRYSLSSKSSLKFSYNRMIQYLQVASNSTAGFPTDRWIPADFHIKPLIGDQIAMGYFRNFNENAWEFSVETYYKWIQNVVDFLPGEDVLLNDNIETAVAEGRAWAYGAEFMLRRNVGNTTGWLSYTLSRTQREIEGVAGGNPYLARFDKPHDVSLVLSHEFSPRFSISGNFLYSTGAAVTFPEGRYVLNEQSVPYYDDNKRNTSRMPDFHRLDVALTWKLKSKRDWFEHDLVLSAYNLYNRKNVFFIEFTEIENNDINFDPDTDGPVTSTRPGSIRNALFGIVPSLTYNFSIK